MIYLSLIFWFVLLLPGYAAMRWFAPRYVEGGLPGAIAVSMFATFALLSPINILGHALRVPLWLFSASIIVCVLAAAVLITKKKWWRDLRSLLIAGLCIELLIVAVDFVLAARVGSVFVGDAITHLSRIRLIMDEGLNNGHPFYGGAYFFPTYHTNIWHALLGSGAQLFGMRHHDLWFIALPVASLLIFGGVWELAWTVFQRQWPAWIAALFALGAYGSLPFLTYPNKLAPLWITPLLLAFVIDAIRNSNDWKPILLIACASLVIAQIHGLYTVFVVLVASPVLLGAIAFRGVRREYRPALFHALAGCALTIGIAFPAYSAMRTDTLEQRISAFAEPEEGDSVSAAELANNGVVTPKRPTRFGRGFTGKWWRMPLVLFIGAVLLLRFKPCRATTSIMLGYFVVCGFWLWIPQVYTPLVQVLGGEWVVARMSFIFRLSFFVIVAGGITAILDHLLRPQDSDRIPYAPWRLASLAALPIAIALFGPRNETFGWTTLLASARTPSDERMFELNSFHALQDLARTEIPAGSILLAPPALGVLMTTVTDCEVVYAYTNNLGAGNRARRALDLQVLTAGLTRPDERQYLLQSYDITYAAFLARPPRWATRNAVHTASVHVPMLGHPVTIIQFPEHAQ